MWVSCQAIIWISVLAGLFQVFANQVHISISALLKNHAEIDGRTYADSEVFSSHSLEVAFSQKTCITYP